MIDYEYWELLISISRYYNDLYEEAENKLRTSHLYPQERTNLIEVKRKSSKILDFINKEIEKIENEVLKNG